MATPGYVSRIQIADNLVFNSSKSRGEQVFYSKRLRSNPVFFINDVLGLPLHPGQIQWITQANRKINILRPGNRWGKTFIEACLHIWHGMTKPLLAGRIDNPMDWLQTTYNTLNFGPEYEGARECLRLARDIIQGHVVLPKEYWDRWGKTNKSKLKDWAIAEDRVEATMMPNLKFVTGADLLARSYTDMGTAFKAKSIAFISGDECADIAELWTFTNITLLPRLVSLGGILHFVGTVQPEGYDYLQMMEMAEDDMKHGGRMFYIQKGSMYDNNFLDREEVKKTEEIADPELRKQIILGEYSEAGQKYFGHERIYNAIDPGLSFISVGLPNRKYIVGADFAGGKSKWSDNTVIMAFDYTDEPYRLAYFWYIRGSDMEIPSQYEKARSVCEYFPGKFIIDGSALGGKNASAFLRSNKPISLDINAKQKAEMLSTLKVAFDGYQSSKRKRVVKVREDGTREDVNNDWGLIRYPRNDYLIKELSNYKLEDKKIRNDAVMTMAMCIWWLEMRRPTMTRRTMAEIDWAQVI